jgi:hypothetical protein
VLLLLLLLLLLMLLLLLALARGECGGKWGWGWVWAAFICGQWATALRAGGGDGHERQVGGRMAAVRYAAG